LSRRFASAPPFPYTTLFRSLAEYAESSEYNEMDLKIVGGNGRFADELAIRIGSENILLDHAVEEVSQTSGGVKVNCKNGKSFEGDRKSTRLNSSHVKISYAV